MKIIDDLKAYSGKSIAKAIYNVLLNSNFQMIFWYRIAHLLYHLRLSFFSKIIMYFHKLIFSVDIDYRAEIGGGLKIVHGIGIVIGKDVVIGTNCCIYKGVVLGGNGNKIAQNGIKTISQPQLGDNVSVFSDASVIGPVIIGNNSKIGASALIMSDVPPDVTVFCKMERCVLHENKPI